MPGTTLLHLIANRRLERPENHVRVANVRDEQTWRAVR